MPIGYHRSVWIQRERKTTGYVVTWPHFNALKSYCWLLAPGNLCPSILLPQCHTQKCHLTVVWKGRGTSHPKRYILPFYPKNFKLTTLIETRSWMSESEESSSVAHKSKTRDTFSRSFLASRNERSSQGIQKSEDFRNPEGCEALKGRQACFCKSACGRIRPNTWHRKKREDEKAGELESELTILKVTSFSIIRAISSGYELFNRK